MIRTLVTIGYKDVFNDNSENIHPEDLLRGIPTASMLFYVVAHQHAVVFAFGDVETHKKHISEMCQFLSETEKLRCKAFLERHEGVSLFSSETNFLFYKLALMNVVSGDRPLEQEEIARIYKAYLYCNQIIFDKPIEGLKQEDKTPAIMSMRVDLPIVEFKLYKDFQVQMYKASQFFKFCEQDEKFSSYLTNFLADRKCNDWKQYLLRWFIFLSGNIKFFCTKMDPTQKSEMDFFDKYCIDPTLTANLWETNDQFYLRNHFLYKLKEGLYMLLNFNLMVDKFYQGMLFDFCDSINFHGGPKFNNKTISYRTFHTMLGKTFTETYVLYDLMQRTFEGKFDKIFSGDELEEAFEKAEPDFYMRKGKHVFIIEFKDLTLGNKIKYSTDTQEIIDGITERICKGGSSRREGAGQLANSIDLIVNKKKMHSIDSEAEEAEIIFPILVTTDRSFSALGINYLIIKPFVDILREYNIPSSTHIAPPVIFDYDTLFMISPQLHDGKLVFEDTINEYTSKLLTSPGGLDFLSSYHTFAYDTYKPSEYTKEDIQFLYSNFFEELSK